MKKLLKNKKGFTLIEMLIVVAIIVILVAVSIPTFTAEIYKAAKSTDEANMRAAKAAAIAYMIEYDSTPTGLYYDAEKGVIDTDKPSEGYGLSNGNEGKIIIITVEEGSNTPDCEWEEVD